MLKYQVSAATLNRQRPKSHIIGSTNTLNTASSTISLNSLSAFPASTSRSSSDECCCSSTSISAPPSGPSKLLQQQHRCSSVSSLSSIDGSIGSSSTTAEWGALKIHTGTIKPDTEYKTIKISTTTVAGDIIDMLLNKFRLSARDPKLFYLTMEIKTKRQGIDVLSVLLVQRNARPLELQRCHPPHMSRFVLHMSAGVLVRIYDYYVCPESNYKSVLVSRFTTCAESIALLLNMSRLAGSCDDYVLVTVNTKTNYEYCLPDDALLISVDLIADSEQIHLRHRRTSINNHHHRRRQQPDDMTETENEMSTRTKLMMTFKRNMLAVGRSQPRFAIDQTIDERCIL